MMHKLSETGKKVVRKLFDKKVGFKIYMLSGSRIEKRPGYPTWSYKENWFSKGEDIVDDKIKIYEKLRQNEGGRYLYECIYIFKSDLKKITDITN